MWGLKFVAFILISNKLVNAVLDLEVKYPVFDPEIYENVLDPELCEKQLSYISRNNLLRIKFIDYGLRLPKAITMGGIYDFGSYHECLGIEEEAEGIVIDGKYCMIEVPLEQDINLPLMEDVTNIPDWIETYPNITDYINKHDVYQFELEKKSAAIFYDGHKPTKNAKDVDISKFSINMGMCLPKACTTNRALDGLYVNVTAIGLKHKEQFCRLPGDKPWVPADTVVTTLLSVLGLITSLSTAYDVYHTVIKKRDPKTAKDLLRSFSIYTNTRRILTFNHVPGAIECLDGIRGYAMAWVILGHTFSSIAAGGVISNAIELYTWGTTYKALYIISAPITVDTFFAMSGILVVYSNAGKTTATNFLKSLHLFYLNRLLRLFPILAFGILLQVSVLNRVVDGPLWNHMASSVEDCRVYWWSTLLHLQNYLNPFNKCLTHSWYVTVDVQLHIISPLVLFWVLTGNKKYAWISLATGVIVSFTVATTLIFINKFPSARTNDPEETANLMQKYYWNTLTRAPAFFIGMVFGYIMHLYKKEKVVMRKRYVALAWCATIVTAGAIIYCFLYGERHVGENTTVDSFINAFTKPLWAVCIGWMIFACYHGYGGIVNWILSMNEIKLIGRVSYAMYIVHYPMMLTYVGATVAPIYFGVSAWLYLFAGHFAMSFVIGLIMTILVDSPSSVWIKHFLGGAKKSQPPPVQRMDKNDQKPIM